MRPKSAMDAHHPESQPPNASLSIRFFNRDLNWLEYIQRELNRGLDPSNPPLERLKILAMVSSNIDEFFSFRMSRLQAFREGKTKAPVENGVTATELLQEISRRIRPLIADLSRCLTAEVLPQLADRGISVVPVQALTKTERKFADRYFLENVFPALTPLAVDPSHPFPYISGGCVNLAVTVAGREDLEDDSEDLPASRFVRIKIPANLPRLVDVSGTRTRFTLLESLIAANANLLFPEIRFGQCHAFRVTRDEAMRTGEEEGENSPEFVEHRLGRQRLGSAVRLEVSSTMPMEVVDFLWSSLNLRPGDVYPVNAPLNLRDLLPLYELDCPALKFPSVSNAYPHPFLSGTGFFETIAREDVLLRHPFDSFRTVTDFIHLAAHDPAVVAIKMCLYRIGHNSPIVRSLMEARANGKQVAVLVELRARFDEACNLDWARRLENAGVLVVFGLKGLLTHCTVTQVVRSEAGDLRRYVHLSTGHYNTETARVSTDIGLFTTDSVIGEDVTNLFNYLTGYSKFSEYARLSVAPVNLRARLLKLIDRETAFAISGRSGRIVAKLNNLTDRAIIEALYRASAAGVRIDLIVHEICTLRPGVAGLSERIRVRAPIGRYREHSRIFSFFNDGQEELYIGSGDWMACNFDHRVELLIPVRSPNLIRELQKSVLDIYLDENVRGVDLQSEGDYLESGSYPLEACLQNRFLG